MHAPPAMTGRPRRKLYGLPLIIAGVAIGLGGLILLLSDQQAYDVCNSGLGVLGQAFSAQARANCQADDTGHNVLLVVTVIGGLLLLWGILRMVLKRQPAPVAWQPPPGQYPPPASPATPPVPPQRGPGWPQQG